MAVPCGSIKDEQRARRTAREHLLGVRRNRIGRHAIRWSWLTVGARHETRRSIVGSEFVDHQIESEERPIRRSHLDINVKLLSRMVRAQRSSEKRAQFEGPANLPTANIEQAGIHVDVVECSASIYKVTHTCCRASNP